MLLINFGIITCIFVFSSQPVLAYLDPGSGSFIFQLAVGAVLGGLVTVKFYFRKIRLYLAGLFGKKKKHGPDHTEK